MWQKILVNIGGGVGERISMLPLVLGPVFSFSFFNAVYYVWFLFVQMLMFVFYTFKHLFVGANAVSIICIIHGPSSVFTNVFSGSSPLNVFPCPTPQFPIPPSLHIYPLP